MARVHRSSRSLSIAVAVLLLAATVIAVGATTDDRAEAANIPTPWTVTVSPSTGVIDGQLIRINVSTPGTNPVSEVRAQVCRRGVAYRPNFASQPNADFAIGGPNCPSIPISTSADLTVTDTAVSQYATQPGGRTFEMFVGKGAVNWPLNSGDFSTQSLTCDVDSPCSLVVEVRGRDAAGDLRWIPFVQDLTYLNEDPIAGCGGPANGILTAAGPDRFLGAWIGWTLDQCGSAGAQVGAISSQSFVGEGEAMDGFSRGDVDIAYTALGYDSATGFGRGNRSEPLTQRNSVAVPIALNAAVIGVGNGQQGPSGNKIPFSSVRMPLDLATKMFAGGAGFFSLQDQGTLQSMNPELATSSVFVQLGLSSIITGGASESEAPNYFLTRHFLTTRPSLWKVPSAGVFGPEAGASRTASASLALANPSFQNALQLYSGRTTLDRALKGLGRTDNFGGVWTLTDLVTANALAMTPVSLENDIGVFVAPTAASITAGVGSMITTESGIRVPNPTAHNASPSAAQPYPLSYVEYAMVPLEPLVNAQCQPRAVSQELLVRWLNYLTGPGQDRLPVGMAPLTSELQAEARTAIARVGSAASTCGQTTSVAAPTTPLTDVPSGSVVSSSLTRRSVTASGAAGAAPAGSASGSATLDDSELASAIAALPTFTSQGSNGTRAIVGLLLVFGLLLSGALATSGRLGLRRRG